METLRIATRRSLLARKQAALVAEAMGRAFPEFRFELLPIVTAGDRRTGSLAPVGDKGLFTAALEAALRAGEAHFAVHSAKDMPAVMADDLAVAAVPPREDPRDALVWRGGGPIGALPRGARVGTSSPRRAAQLLALRPDLRIVPIRGNVETRLAKVLGDSESADAFDGVVLAMAGLIRGGLLEHHRSHVRPLEIDEFIPAAGQGALAVQCLAREERLVRLATAIDDAVSREALLAERSVPAALGADCQSCLAVHVRRQGGAGSPWSAVGVAARPDGGDMARFSASADAARDAADALIRRIRQHFPTGYPQS